MEPRYILAEKDLFTRTDSYYKSGINGCLEYVDVPSRAAAFFLKKPLHHQDNCDSLDTVFV